MKDSIAFVRGSVSRRSTLMQLEYCSLDGERMVATDSFLTASAPCDDAPACRPKFDILAAAVNKCETEPELSLTRGGKLTVRSGSFRAHVPCLADDAFEDVDPLATLAEGTPLKADGAALLDAMKDVRRFGGTDATRPFARSLLLRGDKILATNNVVIVERKMDERVPDLIVTLETVDELLRIGVPPAEIKADARTVSFLYDERRWLRAGLLAVEWPDLSSIFVSIDGCRPVPSGFYDLIDDLAPFADQNVLVIGDGKISTSDLPDNGASVDVPELDFEPQFFSYDMFKLLRGAADEIDFRPGERAIAFCNDAGTLRGVLMKRRNSS